MLLFTGASHFLAQHSLRLCHLNNPGLARNALNLSRLASFVADSLIRLESLVGDIHVDWGSHRLFEMPAGNLRMSNFQTDEHCENWTRFKKDELFDSIGRIGLEEQIHVLNLPGHHCIFTERRFLCAPSLNFPMAYPVQ